MTKYKGEICSETSCMNPAQVRNMCKKHYGELYEAIRSMHICCVTDCVKSVKGLGMCAMHYRRWKKNGTTYLFTAPRKVSFCSHATCTDLVRGQVDFCNAHYIEMRKKGVTTDKYDGICQSCGGLAQSGDRRYKFCQDCRPFWHQIKHGISGAQIKSFIAQQDGKCAMCMRVKKLVIDHDHACCSGHYSCGQCLRSLLCFKCNSGIGYLDDDPTLALIGAYYLTAHRYPNEKLSDIQERLIDRVRKLSDLYQ